MYNLLSLKWNFLKCVLKESCPTLCIIFCYSDAILQFTESDYLNVEGELAIVPLVQLLTVIATNLTVQIVPVNITEALARDLPADFPTIPPFNPRRPNIATSKLRNRLTVIYKI